jgi:hypothetical protein
MSELASLTPALLALAGPGSAFPGGRHSWPFAWAGDDGGNYAGVWLRDFISYRRDDSAYPAGWLFDLLAGRFGRDRVFKDVDSLQPGDDFAGEITAAVGACAVLLAVIGKSWLTRHQLRRADMGNRYCEE